MIVKFDPHAFIVFLTLAMGMSYAVFNSFSRWGIWKLFVIAIVVVPFAYIGVSQGHIIEIVLGGLTGAIYAQSGYFLRLKWVRSIGKGRPKQGRTSRSRPKGERSSAQSNAEEEIKRRQRQAQEERERGREQSESEQASQAEEPQGNSSSSSWEKSGGDTKQDIGPLNPTNITDAFKILGLENGASLSECKQAYRTLISIYNSDKINRLSGHRKSQAEEEAKDINRAWATIKKYYDARK